MSQRPMRVIAIGTLREFWEREPKAKTGLQLWYRKITSQHWANPNDVVANFSGADTVGNNRIIFNIHRNEYRLIVTFRYEIQQCFVNFIGTHKEYDRVDVQTVVIIR